MADFLPWDRVVQRAYRKQAHGSRIAYLEEELSLNFSITKKSLLRSCGCTTKPTTLQTHKKNSYPPPHFFPVNDTRAKILSTRFFQTPRDISRSLTPHLTVIEISTTYLSVFRRRFAIHRKRWNGVSPKPNPSGRASASEPIRRSTSSMMPLYASLSSAAIMVSLVSFSKVSGAVKFSNRLNWLYRGTPLSRSLKMSIVARSRNWEKRSSQIVNTKKVTAYLLNFTPSQQRVMLKRKPPL